MAFHRSERQGASAPKDGGGDRGAHGRLALRRPSIAVLAILLVAGLPSLGLSTAADAANTVPAAPSAVSAAAIGLGRHRQLDGGRKRRSSHRQFPLTAFVGSTVSSTQEVTATAVGSNLDPTPGALDSVTFSNGLVDGTTYSFTVSSINSVGTGPASAQTNTVTPTGAPGLPSAAAAVAGNQWFSSAGRWVPTEDSRSPIS